MISASKYSKMQMSTGYSSAISAKSYYIAFIYFLTYFNFYFRKMIVLRENFITMVYYN